MAASQSGVAPVAIPGKIILTLYFSKGLQLIEAEWRIYALVNKPSLVQIMACRLDGAKPLSEPMMEYC